MSAKTTRTGELVAVADLTRRDRDAMFSLMQRYYAGIKRDTFEADLSEKQWVIRIRDSGTGQLCGFSTQVTFRIEVGGQFRRVLFSGDTIVDRPYWNGNPLSWMGGRLVLSLIDSCPEEPWYWFLITMGYRTYRFLPVFFREFYPRYDVSTPAWATRVLDAAARWKYAEEYDPAAGIIHPEKRGYHLRGGVAEVTPARLRDPHVRYFLARNPGHTVGDELCCLAPLARENFTSAARRVLSGVPEACGAVE